MNFRCGKIVDLFLTKPDNGLCFTMEMLSDLESRLSSTSIPTWMTYSMVAPARRLDRFVRELNGYVFLFTVLAGRPDAIKWSEMCKLIDALGPDMIGVQYRKTKVNNLLGKFDSLVSLSPPFHIAHREYAEALHRATILVFPAYDCEFAITETAESIISMMRNCPTVDWGRERVPRIKMRFEVEVPRIGSENFGFTEFDSLIRVSRWLESSPSGFIEVENFKLENLQISKTKDGLFASGGPNAQKMLIESGCLDALTRFVLDGY